MYCICRREQQVKTELGYPKDPYDYFNKELPKLFPVVYLIIADTAKAPANDDWTMRGELVKCFQ
jgi:hypothetical protein